MSETLFSKIIKREIPADIVYEDDDVLAFRDVNPQAPVHVLFIPKRVIVNLDTMQEDDALLVGKLLLAASRFARSEGIGDSGYRCVINCNGDGGQSVAHLHVHLLGGRKLRWPPG